MDEIYRALAARLKRLEADAIRPRIGVVTTASPLEVAVAGAAPVSAKKLAGATLTVGDNVFVATWSGSLIVLGGIE